MKTYYFWVCILLLYCINIQADVTKTYEYQIYQDCDKNGNSSSGEPTSEDPANEVTITLNHGDAQLVITPGEEKRISVQAVGYTGKDKLSYTWASSDTKVATVDKNGTVKGISFGTVTITCSTTISKVVVKGTIEVKVVNKLETLKFTGATVSYSYNRETNAPEVVVSDTFAIATVTATGEEVKGCIISGTIDFFSEGFGYNDNGKLSGPSTGYLMSMPCYIAYADYNMNPNLSDGQGNKVFSKPEDHMTFSLGTWKTAEVEIGGEAGRKAEHTLVAGALKDEAGYLTHIKAAIAAACAEDYDTWFEEQINARKECLSGGMLFEYTYSEESQDYYTTYIPAAIVTSAIAVIESNPNAMYMYKINGFRATISPLSVVELFDSEFALGVEVEENDVTGEYTVTSKKVEFGPTITYNSSKEESSYIAARENVRMLGMEDIKVLKQQMNRPMLQLPEERQPRPMRQPANIEEKMQLRLSTENCDNVQIYDHEYGETITVTAIAEDNSHFVRWSDGNTENPRTITVTKNTSLIAEFANNASNGVTVVPTENDADITWPVIDDAYTYELVIKEKKSGKVICTLVFNAKGQLISLTFDSAAQRRIAMAEKTDAESLKFTVTGLDAGTEYNYTITTKDNNGGVIDTKSGIFRTKGTSALEDMDAELQNSVRKVIDNGRLYLILPDGKKVNVNGFSATE